VLVGSDGTVLPLVGEHRRTRLRENRIAKRRRAHASSDRMMTRYGELPYAGWSS